MKVGGMGTSGVSDGLAGVRTTKDASNRDDSRLKSLRQQIENVQEQLRKLQKNENMPLEQKMKKQQELQKQLKTLQQQYSQRELELQREKREKAAKESAKEAAKQAEEQEARREHIRSKRRAERADKEGDGNADRAAVQDNHMSVTAVQGLLEADAAMTQADTVDGVKHDLEARARTLAGEIRMDGSGSSVEKKTQELAELEAKIDKTQQKTTELAADAAESAQKANETAQKTDKAPAAAVQKNASKPKWNPNKVYHYVEDMGQGFNDYRKEVTAYYRKQMMQGENGGVMTVDELKKDLAETFQGWEFTSYEPSDVTAGKFCIYIDEKNLEKMASDPEYRAKVYGLIDSESQCRTGYTLKYSDGKNVTQHMVGQIISIAQGNDAGLEGIPYHGSGMSDHPFSSTQSRARWRSMSALQAAAGGAKNHVKNSRETYAQRLQEKKKKQAALREKQMEKKAQKEKLQERIEKKKAEKRQLLALEKMQRYMEPDITQETMEKMMIDRRIGK